MAICIEGSEEDLKEWGAFKQAVGRAQLAMEFGRIIPAPVVSAGGTDAKSQDSKPTPDKSPWSNPPRGVEYF